MAQHMIKAIERKGNSYKLTFQDDLNTETVYTYSLEDVDKFGALLRRAKKLGNNEVAVEEEPGILDLFQEGKDYADSRVMELTAAIEAKLEKFERVAQDVCENMQMNSVGVNQAKRMAQQVEISVQDLTDDLNALFKAKMDSLRRAYVELEVASDEANLKGDFDAGVMKARLEQVESLGVAQRFGLAEAELRLNQHSEAYHIAGKRLAEAEAEISRLELQKANAEHELDARIQKLEKRGFKAWLKRVFGRSK